MVVILMFNSFVIRICILECILDFYSVYRVSHIITYTPQTYVLKGCVLLHHMVF